MQAKHYGKRRRKVTRKLNNAILLIAILGMSNISYSIIANAAFPTNETNTLVQEVYPEAQEEYAESKTAEETVVSYEDFSEEQIQAIIEGAQNAGEELVGTAAMIATQQAAQEESKEGNTQKANSTKYAGSNWESLVKSSGGQQLWEDYVLLCRTTHAEAGNQTMEQQIAVAATILNRVGTDGFADTIYGVIFQKGQFSTAQNGQVIDWSGKVVTYENDVSETTKEAVYRALILGEDPTEEWLLEECNSLNLDAEKYAEGGALYFYADYVGGAEAVARSNIKCESQNGTHIFYKVWG